MTQEEKQLLLKDLCARLPYGVKVQRINSFYKWRKEIEDLSDVFLTYNSLKQFENHIEHLEIKPYFRSMSNMTEEEKSWYESLRNALTYQENGEYDLDDFNELNDFLNRRKLDRYGLIDMGLALEAPEGMYKTE